MRAAIAAFLFLFTISLGAEEITVDKVIAAHGFGAPAESILAKINNTANTVGLVTAEDTARMRNAGVPEEVISALVGRAAATPVAVQAVAPAIQPDNPNMVLLVKAIKAGTSESLIAEQINKTGVAQRPSMTDVIYLKENKVSDAVIKALMDAPLLSATGTVTRPGVPPQMIEVDGLVLKKGMFSKNRTGKLTFKADKIEWLDGVNQADSFEMFPAGLKAVEVKCGARPDGKFCHEMEFQMAKGSDFTFVDSKMDVGGNEAINGAMKAIKALYPKLPVVEKIK